MTPREELLKAAERIREIASMATAGPWVDLDRGDRIIRHPDATAREDDSDPCGEGPPLEYIVDEPLVYNPANGAHIALWDPIVAVLVAELFEDTAVEQDPALEVWHRRELAVARAINGGAS